MPSPFPPSMFFAASERRHGDLTPPFSSPAALPPLSSAPSSYRGTQHHPFLSRRGLFVPDARSAEVRGTLGTGRGRGLRTDKDLVTDHLGGHRQIISHFFGLARRDGPAKPPRFGFRHKGLGHT
ncbi:hypothetical protein E2C01_095764 [Portunus trituberculatus]|uniref:Uncharacterized protein n=1 Tax=Portunus trituberculatus TaxID=210409 RepID=A0A5B7JTV4_PORTR|nr:hypothetical protein [Portunus trituberculatus]